MIITGMEHFQILAMAFIPYYSGVAYELCSDKKD